MDAKEENARATEAVDALNAPQNASAIAVPQSHEFVHSASFASSTDSETVEIIDDDGLEHPHVAHVAKTGKDGEDTMEAHPAFSPPPDGGLRAWSTIVASFFMHFIAIGNFYSYGVFQRYYIANNTFPGTTTTEYALIGGLYTFTAFFSGPLVGAFIARVGNRTVAGIGSILLALNFIAASFAHAYWVVALCQGVLFGFFMMICWVPAVSMPAHWFDSKRGLATGLCVSGAGVGGLALAAVTQTMIDQVGFRWALRYLGIGGGAVCFICAFFLPARIVPADQLDIFAAIRRFRRRRNSIAAAPTGPAKPRPPLVDFGMFKDGKFVMLFLVGFFAFWFMNVPFQFAPSFATSVVGTTPGTASVVLGIMNGCSSAGRIVLGAVSDRAGPQNVLLVAELICVISVLAFWIPCGQGAVGLLFVFAVVYGIAAGSLLSMIPTVLASIFGVDSFAQKMGLLYTSFSMGGLAGPPIAGFSLEKTGGFLVIQILTAAFWFASFACLYILRIMSGRTAQKRAEEVVNQIEGELEHPHGERKWWQVRAL